MKDILLKVWAWVRKYLIAPLPILLVVAGAILSVVLGFKKKQIGGILAKLTGKKNDGKKDVDVANTIPEGRVDKDGKLIPIGTADTKGITQAVVVPIESPGMFSNPDTVTIIHPEDKTPVVVQLPDGVKAKDVDKVVIVSPEVHVVTVKDSSKVTGKDVNDLLAKYGG